MVLLFPNMSFAVPGVSHLDFETMCANLAIMSIGEIFLADALVVVLSRTEFISDRKFDLPSAWRERDANAFLVLFACLALLTVFGVSQCVVRMCFTHTWETGREDFSDYTLSLCPVLEAEGASEIRLMYGLYPNTSAVSEMYGLYTDAPSAAWEDGGCVGN